MAAISQTREAGLPTPREAEEALHQALLTSRLRQTLPGLCGSVQPRRRSPGHRRA
ncbi:MAG: hypothetical protein HZY76_12420 [Anaerolineae bacterium]|nr:MAG: hypothetical protein HZY76_12420 [Anaerolineae bacterium]